MNPSGQGLPEPPDKTRPKRPRRPFSWAAVTLVTLGVAIAFFGPRWALAVGLGVAAIGGFIFAILAPARLSPKRTFEYYLSLTQTSHPQGRRAGVAGLSSLANQLGAERRHIAAMRVGELADDPSEDVRWSAASALTNFAPLLAPATATALVPRAKALTRDGDPRVRQMGVQVLAAVAKVAGGEHPAAASQRMWEMFEEEDPVLSLWVLDAFAALAEGLEAEDQERWVRALLQRAANPASPASWKAGATLAKAGLSLKTSARAAAAHGLVGIAEQSGGEQAELALHHLEGLTEGDQSPLWAGIAGGLVRISSSPDRRKSLPALGLIARLGGALEGPAAASTAKALQWVTVRGDEAVTEALEFCLVCLGQQIPDGGGATAAQSGLQAALRIIGSFSSDDPSVRRWARGVWPAAFRLVDAPSRDGALERLVSLHKDPALNVRSAASSSLIASRREFAPGEATKVAEGLVRVLGSADGDIQRLATVTIVGIYDCLESSSRESCRLALAELSGNQDRVVADQAEDSLEAIRELRPKRRQPAA